MKIESFKDNSIFIAPKVMINSELFLNDNFYEACILSTSYSYLIISFIINKSYKKILRTMMKEPNLFSHWTEDGKLYFQLIIPEDKQMRSGIIQKCGYDGLLKSEIIDLVLFYKENSAEVLKYYEKTLAARDE